MLQKNINDEIRRKEQHKRIFNIQQNLGITITSPWYDYKNQKSKLGRSCDKCVTCESPFVIADKALSGQVCKKLGRLKSAKSRRNSNAQLIKNVLLFDCEIVSGLESYLNNKSLITVRHIPTGKIITRLAQDFRINGRVDKLLNDFICSKGVGETITCAVSHYLLSPEISINLVTEITPDYLAPIITGKKYRLIHDAYFILENNLKIAVEHQGNYHVDPDDPHNHMGRTFAEVKERDNFVREKCLENKVVLVEICDLVSHTKNILQATDLVVSRLVECAPQIQLLEGFENRVQELKDEFFVFKLCLNSSIKLTGLKHLKEQIAAEGLQILIKAYDPVSSFFDLECNSPCHQTPHNWSAHSKNLIGSKVTERKGTRCPKCADIQRAEKRKLTHHEVTLSALNHGAMPLFFDGEYQRNKQKLPWIWIACQHSFEDTLGHIQEGRCCKTCRKKSRDENRREREFFDISKIVINRGDILLSSKNEYLHQKSVMRIICSHSGGCGKEFNQAAVKIKNGQSHSCDKYSRSWLTRLGKSKAKRSSLKIETWQSINV